MPETVQSYTNNIFLCLCHSEWPPVTIQLSMFSLMVFITVQLIFSTALITISVSFILLLTRLLSVFPKD